VQQVKYLHWATKYEIGNKLRIYEKCIILHNLKQKSENLSVHPTHAAAIVARTATDSASVIIDTTKFSHAKEKQQR